MKYTIVEIQEMAIRNKFSLCLCTHEKNGKVCSGTDTIQVALHEDSDYFGEFVGKPEKDSYTFKWYK